MTAIVDSIKAKKEAFEAEHGRAPQHCMVGAVELKQFIEENIPEEILNDPNAVNGTQFSSVFGMQMVSVLKLNYLEVC